MDCDRAPFRYRVLRALGAVRQDVIHIEGGLGSQILGMIAYKVMRDQDPRTRADVSFFYPRIDAPIENSTGLVVRRPWALDIYGIQLDDFEPVRKIWRIHPSPEDQAQLQISALQAAAHRDWSDFFPLPKIGFSALSQLDLTTEEPFACVHVRRGDYLKVSSRIITLEEQISALKTYALRLPEKVVFLSDDAFSQADKHAVEREFANTRCHFPTDLDEHSSHSLMRMAKLLVTSNSTFSWTAGLLTVNPDAVILSPTHFFGPSHPIVNMQFQSNSEWMLSRKIPDLWHT